MTQRSSIPTIIHNGVTNGILTNRSVKKWTVNEVVFFLKECGFSQSVQQAFRTHHIDGTVLLLLEEEDLRREPLQLTILGDIKKLALCVRKLKSIENIGKDHTDIKKKSNNSKKTNPSNKEELTESRELDDKKVDGSGLNEKQINDETVEDNISEQEEDEMDISLQQLPETLGMLWEQYLPALTIPSPLDAEPWSSMLSKLFVSLCFFCFSIFMTAVTMTFVHERLPDPTTYPPLPDIILDNLPLIPWAFAASELLAMCLLLLMFGVLFVHKYRSIILRRMCAIVGAVFLLRCITMFVTSLSVPGKHLGPGCKQLEPLTSIDQKLYRAWLIASRFGLSITGLKTCGDYCFSGHSVVLTLLNLFIVEYTPKSWRGLHIMSWSMSLFGMFFVLAAHEHYSLDVFLAFYISSRLFSYYHHNANIIHAIDVNKEQHGPPFIYLPLFSYLEENMVGKLPNEYEWPWTPFFKKRRNINRVPEKAN
jgi:hypothetical protein